jgi:hypothetical protein
MIISYFWLNTHFILHFSRAMVSCEILYGFNLNLFTYHLDVFTAGKFISLPVALSNTD